MTTWDAVWLNDEIDLLVWRIALLREVVDKVLVVEGDRVFSGSPKGSAFRANARRLHGLGAELHHVVVPLAADAENAWDRENAQRRGMAEALRRLASPGDLVLACDVDEVPRPSAVRLLASRLDRPVRLHMVHANYYANWVHREPWRNSAWAFRLGQERDHQMLRVHFGEPHSDWEGYVEEYLPDAGWHLSFMGGEAAVRRKWAAYSHQENNTELDRRPGHLERCFRYGVHFTGAALLVKQQEVEPELASLQRARPDLFRFDKPSNWWLSRAVMSWTWLRRKEQVPERLRRSLDESTVLLALVAPGLWALHGAARAKKRFRGRSSFPTRRPWEPGRQPAG